MDLKIVVGLIGVAVLFAVCKLAFVLFYGWVAIEVDKHREAIAMNDYDPRGQNRRQ